MATVNLYYFGIRASNRGSLKIQITHNNTRARINLGLTVSKEIWDSKKCRLKKTDKQYKNISRVNNFLQSQLAEANNIIMHLADEGKLHQMTAADIKKKIENKDSGHIIYIYVEKLIKDLISTKKIGTAQSYKHMIISLCKFKNKDIKFQDIDYKFLKKYEQYLLIEGLKINSISVYMRALRAIYNKAINDDLITTENYPFKKFHIKSEKTRKRALSINDIKSFNNVNVEPGTIEFLAQKLFMFSFYARGMNLIDIAHIKKQNEYKNINYKRQKTSGLMTIGINEKLLQIINLFKDNKTNYAFPVFDKKLNTEEEKYKFFKNKRKMLNTKIKLIAKKAKIDNYKNISFYAARHSWATIAKNKRVPLDVISESLGHSDLKTTQIYLESLDNSIINNYNDIVTDLD